MGPRRSAWTVVGDLSLRSTAESSSALLPRSPAGGPRHRSGALPRIPAGPPRAPGRGEGPRPCRPPASRVLPSLAPWRTAWHVPATVRGALPRTRFTFSFTFTWAAQSVMLRQAPQSSAAACGSPPQPETPGEAILFFGCRREDEDFLYKVLLARCIDRLSALHRPSAWS
jgi:hypothetical protein